MASRRIGNYRNHLLAACLGMAALVSAATALAQESGPTGGGAVVQASLGPGFTYQGELRSGGSPITGNCDIQFKLFDASSGPAQLGGTATYYNLGLLEGRFTAQLNFGDDFFDGSARWLELAVRCPAGAGSFTTLAPRQALTAVPYAHSLKPGSQIITSDPALTAALQVERYSLGAALMVVSNGGSGANIGVSGYASGAGTGIRGFTDHGVGVKGSSDDGWAFSAEGNTRQDRDTGGWVKANLAVVGSNGAISRCFNSQHPQPSAAETSPCNFTVTRNSAGSYTIDFNFTVTDRYISITPYYAANTAIVPIIFSFPAGDQVTIKTLTGANVLTDSDFHVTVY